MRLSKITVIFIHYGIFMLNFVHNLNDNIPRVEKQTGSYNLLGHNVERFNDVTAYAIRDIVIYSILMSRQQQKPKVEIVNVSQRQRSYEICSLLTTANVYTFDIIANLYSNRTCLFHRVNYLECFLIKGITAIDTQQDIVSCVDFNIVYLL